MKTTYNIAGYAVFRYPVIKNVQGGLIASFVIRQGEEKMSLKERFQSTIHRLHSFKDHFRFIVEIKTANAAEKFSTLITDIKIEKISKINKKFKIGLGAGVLCVAVIAGAVFFIGAEDDVYKLTVAGKDAGYLSDPEMVPLALEAIKTDMASKSAGAEIIVDDKAVSLEEVDLKTKDIAFLTDDQLKEIFISAELCKANIWAININGTNVVSALTEADANSILEGVKSHYLTEDSQVISTGFKENVVVTQAALNADSVLNPEDAINLIVTGTKEPKVYTVQDGDTLWDIAIANGMSPPELAEANPGFDPDDLKIGQQLNLYQVKSYVTVQTKEVVAAAEKINYNTVYESTDTLYKGETKVKTPGVYGERQIKTELTKENGIVVASAQLESEVVSEPQDQVALKGTKSIATFTGSGSFSSPLTHIEISSAYGVNRGSTRHTGVDFRNPKGTPILAADDGVVIAVSSGGSPGKMVKLSHGNGLETWYEHCDAILVSVGQVVKKGEQIATVGATGNATGYHLHFEVRKNGVPQNPMNYL